MFHIILALIFLAKPSTFCISTLNAETIKEPAASFNSSGYLCEMNNFQLWEILSDQILFSTYQQGDKTSLRKILMKRKWLFTAVVRWAELKNEGHSMSDNVAASNFVFDLMSQRF